MALDKDRLGNAIADRVIATMATPPGAGDEASLRTLMKAIADEVIKEFKNNALVNVNVASVSAVTPGVGVSGPGTGTGTIL